MAKFFINEYNYLAVAAQGAVAAPQQPPIRATQVVAIGTEADSIELVGKFVEVHADIACSFRFFTGADQDATVDDMRLGPGETRYYGIHPGTFVSVIANP